MHALFARTLPNLPNKRRSKLLACLKTLLELVKPSAGINELLLTGEEGMALGANFNSHLAALGGSGGYGLAASAFDHNFFIFGMDSCLHCSHLTLTVFIIRLIIAYISRNCKSFFYFFLFFFFAVKKSGAGASLTPAPQSLPAAGG
jgi:hypothetical protein